MAVQEGELAVALRLDGMFDARAVELIEKGFTAVLRYNVELWMVRSRWFDSFVCGSRAVFKFEFNLLDERYTVTKLSTEGREVFDGLDRPSAVCAATDSVCLFLDPAERVDQSDACYLVAWAEREPLTADDVESLRRWLVDLGRSGGTSTEGTFNRILFRLAGDLFSYRNRQAVSSQSRTLRLEDLR